MKHLVTLALASTLSCVALAQETKVSIALSGWTGFCLLYTSPSPRDSRASRMPSSA